VAGVEHAPRSGGVSGLDGSMVQLKRLFTQLVDRDYQHLRRARECRRQTVWLGKIARTDVRAPFSELGCLSRVSDAGDDPIRRHAGEQPLHDGPSELAVGSSHDDHGRLSLTTIMETRYRR